MNRWKYCLLFRGYPKTQVGYSQRAGTAVKTCTTGQDLCAEPVTIASFLDTL